jgi:hypothetical protein
MASFRGGKRCSDEQEDELDEFTEELSTFTNADAPSLVFEAGSKSITIKQVRLSASSFKSLFPYFIYSDLRRHNRARSSSHFNTTNLRMTAAQTLGVTSHCGAIVWDAGHVQPSTCLLQLALHASCCSARPCTELPFHFVHSCRYGALRRKAVRPSPEGMQLRVL